MTYLECLKEDEKYRKVSEAVADYPDLSAKLMGAIMQHDCCIKRGRKLNLKNMKLNSWIYTKRIVKKN